MFDATQDWCWSLTFRKNFLAIGSTRSTCLSRSIGGTWLTFLTKCQCLFWSTNDGRQTHTQTHPLLKTHSNQQNQIFNLCHNLFKCLLPLCLIYPFLTKCQVQFEKGCSMILIFLSGKNRYDRFNIFSSTNHFPSSFLPTLSDDYLEKTNLFLMTQTVVGAEFNSRQNELT